VIWRLVILGVTLFGGFSDEHRTEVDGGQQRVGRRELLSLVTMGDLGNAVRSLRSFDGLAADAGICG
jgi:hypothetical protein